MDKDSTNQAFTVSQSMQLCTQILAYNLQWCIIKHKPTCMLSVSVLYHSYLGVSFNQPQTLKVLEQSVCVWVCGGDGWYAGLQIQIGTLHNLLLLLTLGLLY